MIEADIWLAILPQIEGFTEAGVDVVLPDTVYSPIATRAFIYVNPTWFPYDSGIMSFDCGDEYRGQINAAVRVPLHWEYTAHIGLANRFMARFPAGSQYTSGSVVAQIYEKPTLNASAYLDGPLNRIDCTIPVRAWG